MSQNLRAASSVELETELLAARQRVRDLRRRLAQAERAGASTRRIRPTLAAAVLALAPIEAEWARRYAG